jgi:hypothetical protein
LKDGISNSSLNDLRSQNIAVRNVFEIDPAECDGNILDSLHDLMRIFCVKTDRKCIDAAELFEELTFPSITGIAAAGPISPRPSTAVPSETTATVFFFIVRLNRFSGSF